MNLKPEHIDAYNQAHLEGHQRKLSYWTQEVALAEPIIKKLIDFQIAIPSWALGTGGTRFGRFPGGGNPAVWKKRLPMWACCTP
jgi:L-rhamnose isomerase/sugar isomerase